MPLKVNGAPLDDALIREEANVMRPHLFRSMPGTDPRQIEIRLREWAVENAIEKALLRQAALADPESGASRANRGGTPPRSPFLRRAGRRAAL